MRICICDDDIFIHNEIKTLLHSIEVTDTQFDITSFLSGEELVKHYAVEKYFDIIFLDVEMDQVNGIKVAEIIRKIDPDTIIIFVSSHENYVFEVFRFDALHFIRKPVSKKEFTEVFQRAISRYRSLNSFVTLKWQSERNIIKISDILYVEGYKRHITVYTNEDKYESIGKLADILDVLKPHGFIRVHQGFIVNMDYIKRFDSTDVILKNNEKVMISVRKRTEALKAYDIYLRKWKW
ncbi:MAG: response regulator transcription factor [Clostridia bacterium]|nr:response regulator transcription factor [Clostridia bacterium]MBQ6467374.1 response regulator transcription factor [Clostridia bacterium]